MNNQIVVNILYTLSCNFNTQISKCMVESHI